MNCLEKSPFNYVFNILYKVIYIYFIFIDVTISIGNIYIYI